VHRVRRFVEVGSGWIGYAMTEAALAEVRNGAKWNPDPSFNLAGAILADPEFACLLKIVFEGRTCHGPTAEGEGTMNEPGAERSQWVWFVATLVAMTIIALIASYPR
jgi:hypothetical protein